ncbi:MAG: amidohydrolase family protein [Saprospiraceae bacterium]|nr:amidohydrolase family protein [Saprospiraceae bacterium]
MVLWCTAAMYGQQSDAPVEVTRNYFIRNAFVVSKPGVAPSLQSIIIRDGIIDRIGPGLSAPPDCKVVAADSMYVYAGFIDMMSHTGIKKEEEKKDAPKPASRGVANFEQSGITPQITALSKLAAKETSVGDLRKAGFTISQVFPRGKMIAGTGAIISLVDADHEDKMVIRQGTALHSSFTTASGAAPSTVIGVIARYRDLYKNVASALNNEETFALNPAGLKRPVFSKELQALVPAYRKEMPVYFVAPKSKDVFRAIDLQKELGYKMVLSEIKHILPALNEVKAGGYSVLLSLDLPDEIKEEGSKKGEEGDASKKEDKGQKTEKKEEETKKPEVKKEKTPEEKDLEARKKKSYDEYLSQAAVLEKNAIPFGFSLIEVKPADVLKNIRRLVKAGLSESAALAALTTVPADWLGLSKTNGTLEPGKSANLVVADKAIFEEKSAIKRMLVDGNLYVMEDKPKGEGKVDEKGMKIEGEWSYVVDVPGQPQTGKLSFTRNGRGYTGTSVSDNDPGTSDALEDITVEAESVKFNMTVDMGQPTTVSFDLTFMTDSYSGSVVVTGMGSFPIKGNKIKGPKNQSFSN